MPDVKTTIAEAASAILALGTWGGHILRATAGHLVTLSQLSSADGTTPTTPTTTAGSAGHVGLDVNITGGTVTIDETTLATSAKQDTAAALLTTLAGIVSGGKGQVTETSAAAILGKLADPATQATLAALVAANHTDLAAIQAKLPAVGQALAAGSVPVVLTAIQAAYLAPVASFSTPAQVSVTGGSAAALSSATAIKGVWVQSDTTNNVNLRAGDSAITTTRGIQLAPGDRAFFECANASAVYLITESGTTKANIWIT